VCSLKKVVSIYIYIYILQKVVRSASVGKLAPALDEFVRDSIQRQLSLSGRKQSLNARGGGGGVGGVGGGGGGRKSIRSLSDSDFWRYKNGIKISFSSSAILAMH
jgi:hypothetical protein